MHWVIQQSIFKPGNYSLLVDALDAMDISYTTVAIRNGTVEMTPDVSVAGKVYVCGAIRLAQIARNKGWVPGSFLNENFVFQRWRKALGAELLNDAMTAGRLADIAAPRDGRFFIRPAEDNKAFDGTVIDAEMLADWRRDPTKQHLQAMDVIVAPVRQIYREYRLFVVNHQVITGSVYKVGGKPHISSEIEDDVLDYARTMIGRWTPAESLVIDIALTADGFKVIEFNNINSSGFYASDVAKYVAAIQSHYA